MNNAELITKVVELVQENTELKLKEEKYKKERIVSDINVGFTGDTPTVDELTLKLAKYGEEILFENTRNSWVSVKAQYKENEEGDVTDEIIVTKYNSYKDNVVCRSSIPGWMSLDVYWEIMENYYKELYESKKEQAIKELKNEQE